MAILGIDPGTSKCGFAIVEALGAPPLALGIARTPDLAERVAELVARYAPTAIALGGGTHGAVVSPLLAQTGVRVVVVDERGTTLLARARYFAAHPPRGWARLIPRGMLLPPVPIDDFAAVLIAERYLAISDCP